LIALVVQHVPAIIPGSAAPQYGKYLKSFIFKLFVHQLLYSRFKKSRGNRED